jgi:hypothetical protein
MKIPLLNFYIFIVHASLNFLFDYFLIELYGIVDTAYDIALAFTCMFLTLQFFLNLKFEIITLYFAGLNCIEKVFK